MPVTTDIVQAHVRPRKVMARLLGNGIREDRALAMLMGASFIMLIAQWPTRAREAHLEGLELTDLIQNDVFALIFVFPLMAYGIAALTHLIAKLFKGQGTWFGARLALFWSLLASTPLIVLAGMVRGLIGTGPANTLVGALWFAIFLWIWINSLWEAEKP